MAHPCWHGLTRRCHLSLFGGVVADVDQWLTATWHRWDPLVRYVGPTWVRWTNEVLTRGTDMLRWPNKVLTRVTPSLFSDSVCVCLGSPVCTLMCLCPQVAPRIALIKSQPLIFPFNLFYLPWIYFDSSTYPKIMKFSSKIPKFMMIIPVIFDSIFTPVSLS
jgi:hypothetical protein